MGKCRGVGQWGHGTDARSVLLKLVRNASLCEGRCLPVGRTKDQLSHSVRTMFAVLACDVAEQLLPCRQHFASRMKMNVYMCCASTNTQTNCAMHLSIATALRWSVLAMADTAPQCTRLQNKADAALCLHTGCKPSHRSTKGLPQPARDKDGLLKDSQGAGGRLQH